MAITYASAASQTKVLEIIKEQSVADWNDGLNKGNGEDLHAPVGYWNGIVFRELYRVKLDWTDVYQIEEAYLVLTTTPQEHVARGGTPRALLRRLSEAFKSGGGAENSWSPGSVEVYPGASSTGTTLDTKYRANNGNGLKTANGVVDRIRITEFLEAWAPATVLKKNGNPGDAADNYGFRIISYDEGSTSRTAEWFSIRAAAAKRPHVELVYSNNHPPLPPEITSPVGTDAPEYIPTVAGTEDTTTFGFRDEDAGDTCAAVRVEYYGSSALDEATGDLELSTGDVTPTPLGALDQYSVKATGLTARTEYRKRVYTMDDKGAWSEPTSLADGYIRTAYQIGAPVSPFMQSTPDGPHIYGTINSGDPNDYVTGWEGEFYKIVSGSRVTLWAPGKIDIGGTPTRSDVVYQGAALSAGDEVYWKHRHYNRDGQAGEWSVEYKRVIEAQTGPSTMSPADDSTKLTSRTAQLTISDTSAFDGYRWRLYRGGSIIHDSGDTALGTPGVGDTTVDVNIPDGLANWCDDLGWDARIKPAGGAYEEYSPIRPLHINCLPTTSLSASE